jgi:hypothetical protein
MRTSLEALRTRRQQLLASLTVPPEGKPGSLALSHPRCGSPTCHCQTDPQGHPAWTLTFMVAGTKRVVHIPHAEVEDIRRAGAVVTPALQEPHPNFSRWNAWSILPVSQQRLHRRADLPDRGQPAPTRGRFWRGRHDCWRRTCQRDMDQIGVEVTHRPGELQDEARALLAELRKSITTQ